LADRTARLSPTAQEIRSQDYLFVSTARAAYPPFAGKGHRNAPLKSIEL